MPKDAPQHTGPLSTTGVQVLVKQNIRHQGILRYHGERCQYLTPETTSELYYTRCCIVRRTNTLGLYKVGRLVLLY